MDFAAFVSSDLFAFGILPALIFLSRIVDVTIGTLRIIFISKGYRYIAPILAFFEIMIWLLAMQQVFANLDNWIYFLAYGLGYATGTFVGMIIEEKVCIGKVIVRVITRKSATELIASLRKEGYRVTTMLAKGKKKPVRIIFMVTKRAKIGSIVQQIQTYNPKAFYTIEDVKFAKEPFRLPRSRPLPSAFPFYRPGK